MADTDVVRGPHGAEVVAEGGQLAEQVARGPVVRFASGLDAPLMAMLTLRLPTRPTLMLAQGAYALGHAVVP